VTPNRATESDGEPDSEPDDRGVQASAWDLVRRTQDGDAGAFGQLYDMHVDMVYRFIYYRLGDRPQAEDLTSETFVRALRRISSVSEQGHDIAAWLVTIARNLVLDHVKSAHYRLSVTTDEIFDSHSPEDTEATVLGAFDQRALLEAVQLLSPEQQESIVLRYFQGLSLAETAQVMGRNAGAVKALQHRALRRLYTVLTAPVPPTASASRPRPVPARHRPPVDPNTVRKRYRTRLDGNP
jgi:RNA polymerase sigma-70 factor (ECF subfamily)